VHLYWRFKTILYSKHTTSYVIEEGKTIGQRVEKRANPFD